MGNLVLIAGVSGVGKTVGSATFPGKKLILDFDNGTKSIYNTKGTDGKLLIKDADEIESVKFYGEDYFPLDLEVGATDKNSQAPAHTKNAIKMFNLYNTVMEELRKDSCLPAELVESKSRTFNIDERVGPFQTIIIDTLTNVWRIWKDALLAKRKRTSLDISDYGVTEGLLYKQFIPGLKSLSHQLGEAGWIILLDHEMIEKDELTGKIYEFPVGPSKAQGKNMAAEFDEVWRQVYSGGKYSWKTKNHGRFEGASSRLDLPEVITPATYQELQKHVK